MEVGTESLATCASVHPKPTTLGINAPYRVSRMSAETLLAHVAGLSVSTSVGSGRLFGFGSRLWELGVEVGRG